MCQKEEIERVIIGIDPGLSKTGYGIIACERRKLRLIDYGTLPSSPRDSLEKRLFLLSQQLEEKLMQFSPSEMAVEDQFLPLKGRGSFSSVLKLGMSKAVALLAAAKEGIPVFHYAPASVKKSLTGNGRASKPQMQYMVAQTFSLSASLPEDAADALALALCHHFSTSIVVSH